MGFGAGWRRGTILAALAVALGIGAEAANAQTLVPVRMPLPVVTLDPGLENLLAHAVRAGRDAVHPIEPGLSQRIVQAVKRLRLPVRGTLGFEKAEVTSGGVSLDEVDSRTMESKAAANSNSSSNSDLSKKPTSGKRSSKRKSFSSDSTDTQEKKHEVC